ncbi:MAG TPA: sugar isomerase, partial [Clostridiales bacterium]|nr:sugar isomerase [Clostridiales bacterium]
MLAYGSEVNGLFSSVGQIFGYVALLEAGIGAATIQVLYKPVVAGDKSSINHILSATKKYYKKVSFYYFACIVVISLLYPMLIHSNINKLYIGFIVFLQGLSGVINFYFQATLKQLLLAEGKNYIETNVSMMTHIITSFARVFLILSSANIVLIQLVYLLTTILEMLFYYFYFKKKYPWLHLHAKPDFSSLQQKNAFLIHQISGLIFSSTD